MEHVLSLNIAYVDSDEETEAALDDAALAALLAEWSGGDDKHARWIAFELRLILFFGPNPSTGHRRTNPAHRSMQRQGKRYRVCKDHGTTARCKEIEAINAQRKTDKPSSDGVRAQRKARKHEARSGHPRYKLSALA